MTRRPLIIAALSVAALGIALAVGRAQSADIGHALVAMHMQSTIFEVNNGHGWEPTGHSSFDPAAHTFSGRYFAGGPVPPGGSLTGERCGGTGPVGLLDPASRPACIARGLGFADSYVLTGEDSGDLAYVAAPNGQQNACDYLAQLYRCGVPPEPTSSPAPTATPAATIPPACLSGACLPECGCTPHPTPSPTPVVTPSPPPPVATPTPPINPPPVCTVRVPAQVTADAKYTGTKLAKGHVLRPGEVAAVRDVSRWVIAIGSTGGTVECVRP